MINEESVSPVSLKGPFESNEYHWEQLFRDVFRLKAAIFIIIIIQISIIWFWKTKYVPTLLA